jgi:phage terminase large subunit-like protein
VPKRKPPAASSPASASARPRDADGEVDFVRIADDYAAEAAADKKGRKFGKWVRLAARRYIADRKRARAKGAPFRFDPWAACDPCRFLECLPHVEGTWGTETIELHPAHVFATVNIFGFRNLDGSRRFTDALFAVARKNAKSTWAAGVALYCQTCEGEVGPQVISAATTGSQARIVWSIAKRQVERTLELRDAFNLEAFANSIASWKNGGSFKPINAKASTQDGLNPSCVVLDELHAHKTHDLLNVLKSAAGARRSPLFLLTTTEGYESPGPWAEERKFAQQVLEGAVEADHYFAVIYALDDKDDLFNPAVWIKANPLMDVNPVLAEKLRTDAIEAKAKPGKLAEFSIKRCNRPAASASSWVDLPRWIACDGAVDLDWLAGYPCTAAFDLSSTTDLTAWRLVWRVEGKTYTWGRRWVPQDAVAQRSVRGTVPYQAWVAGGHMTQTEGDVVDYAVVEAAIRADVERFKPTVIAYDSWNAQDLVNRLTADELPLVQFIQGPRSYHPAMQELERIYRGGNLCHGGDPVLRWCAANLVARSDANLNTAPDKKRSAEKIDDMVALLMALGVSLTPGDDGDYIDEMVMGI